MPSNTQRRQIMQPWPLCLVPFTKTKERNVLPNYYTRVPSIARSSTTSSGITLDCASNATLATNASPFNSQTALLVEKKRSPNDSNSLSPNHYYVENLKNNQLFNSQPLQKPLAAPRIYDPLDKGLDADYKQLDPLLAKDPHEPTVKGLMSTTQEEKDKDATQEVERLPPSQFQKDQELSPKRFIKQKPSHEYLFTKPTRRKLQKEATMQTSYYECSLCKTEET